MKKYKTGYMAGVYDLFHVGHLNLIIRAKEQCEYLIVGVLTDEEVVRWKPQPPFIPYEERVRIVAAVRYVDQVVGVSSDNITRIDAWKRYRFDCQFSGDDYANDKGWLYDQQQLRMVGSDLVFLPYTKTTSSTKIRTLINQALQ